MTVAERAGALIEGAVRGVSSPVITGIAAFNRWRLPPRDAPHPLLTGIHLPMTEELTLTDLVVESVIPPELNGRYVRIGVISAYLNLNGSSGSARTGDCV